MWTLWFLDYALEISTPSFCEETHFSVDPTRTWTLTMHFRV
jgi:hypothetical protein